jgi:hypothetical protein
MKKLGTRAWPFPDFDVQSIGHIGLRRKKTQSLQLGTLYTF